MPMRARPRPRRATSSTRLLDLLRAGTLPARRVEGRLPVLRLRDRLRRRRRGRARARRTKLGEDDAAGPARPSGRSMAKTDAARRRRCPTTSARRAIREDLGTSLLVEAAAGTGKTTSLVERMIGAHPRRARRPSTASRPSRSRSRRRRELSERFQTSSRRPRAATTPDEQDRLEAALARLDSAFVGTIHAFCARLLRERPVEAGVDPGFAEMDEPENAVARGSRPGSATPSGSSPTRARSCRASPRSASASRTCARPTRRSRRTRTSSRRSGPRSRAPDFAAERRGGRGVPRARRPRSCRPRCPPGRLDRVSGGRAARARGSSALRDTSDAAAFVAGARRPRAAPATTARRRAGCASNSRRSAATSLEPGADALAPSTSTRSSCAAVAPAARRVRRVAAAQRPAELPGPAPARARDLLRDHPHVRRALPGALPAHPRRRVPGHRPDPGRDPLLPDRRRHRGDGLAQARAAAGSALRRRRPEAVDLPLPPRRHRDLRRRARPHREAAAASLELSTNFRSTRPALRLGQRASSRGQFPADGDAAAGRRGSRSRRSGAEGAPGVFRPRVAHAGPRRTAPSSTRTPTRIARAHRGRRRASGERAPGRLPRPLPHAQVHVATTRASSRRAGIPYELAGGGAFDESRGARGRCCPCSPPSRIPTIRSPFVAVLRGPLFGVDDEALYRLRRAGGRFSFRADAARGRRPADRAAPASSCARARRSRGDAAAAARDRAPLRPPRLDRATPPPRELGDSRAGNLLKALAAARTFSAEGLDFAAVVARARPADERRATSRR